MSDRHEIEHPLILLYLVPFKFLDGELPPVHSYEITQLFEILNRPFSLLYGPLELHNSLLLAFLGLKKRFERGLPQGQFLHLSDLFSLFLLALPLSRYHVIAAFQRVEHSLDVEHFSPDPETRLFERVLKLSHSLWHADFELLVLRVRQCGLRGVVF